MSVRTFLEIELVGAAALALWTVAVFPQLGPKTVRSTLAALFAGLLLLELIALGVPAAVRLPGGAYLVLFGLVLPALFAVFLACAWTLQLLAGSLGGGSGGGGHRVPAVSGPRG
jgi:hypothetical protein